MDQDVTWHGGRPQLRRLCVRWGPSPPHQKGGQAPPQFSAHVYCNQTAGWIKMPLCMEGTLCYMRTQSFSPKRGRSPTFFGPCLLRPNSCMVQDATWYGGKPRPRRHCVRWGSSSPLPKKGAKPPPQFYFRPMSIVANRLDRSR